MLTIAAKRLRILVLGLLLAGVSTLLLAPSAGAASAEALRAIGTGCEQNGLPNLGCALRRGRARHAEIEGCRRRECGRGLGRAVGEIEADQEEEERQEEKGDSRAQADRPETAHVPARQVQDLSWRQHVLLSPAGQLAARDSTEPSLSAAVAVGKRHVGVQQKKPRPRPQPQPITTVPEPGLISIAGAAYRDWPRLQELFSFGVDLPTPQGDDEPSDEKRSEADSVGSR